MPTEAIDSSSLPPWQVEHLRLTSFVRGDSSLIPLQEWTSVAKQTPESDVSLPKQGEQRVSGLVEHSEFARAELTLRITPIRIDWILRPAPQQEGPSPPPTLGDIEPVVEAFRVMLTPHLTSSDDQVMRMALGGAFLAPAGSREEAVASLNSYLPFQLSPPAFDFLYQINDPVVSVNLSDNKKINRLTKWSVAQVNLVMLNPSAAPDALVKTGPPFIAARLEVDLNTSADRTTPLPNNKLADLVVEFRDELLQIARGEGSA